MHHNKIIFLGDIKDYNSFLINKFVKEYQISYTYQDNTSVVDLDYLRRVYKVNPSLFTLLKIEITIRGGRFFGNNGEQLFYQLPQQKRILRSNSLNNQKYKTIVFPVALKRFFNAAQVDKDSYFDGICIDSFPFVFGHSLEKLFDAEKSFQYAGFSVINLNNQNFTKNNISGIHLPNNSNDNLDIFLNENKFTLIKKYLRSMNILRVEDVTDEDIIRLSTLKGIGPKRVDDLRIKLLTLSQSIVTKPIQEVTQVIFPFILFGQREYLKIIFSNQEAINNGIIWPQNSKLFVSLLKDKNIKGQKQKEFLKMIYDEYQEYVSWRKNEQYQQINNISRIKLINLIEAFQLEEYKDTVNNSKIKFNEHATTGNEEIINELIYLAATVYKMKNKYRRDFQAFIDNNVRIKEIYKIDNNQEYHTLEFIGQEIGVTRERVRQLKQKIKNKKIEIGNRYRLQEYISLTYFSSRDLILKQTISSDDYQYLEDVNSPIIVGKLPVLLTPSSVKKPIREILIKLDEKLISTDTVSIQEVKSTFTSFFNVEEVILLLNQIKMVYEFQYKDDIHLYKKISIEQAIIKAIDKQPNRTLQVNHRSVDSINKYIQSIFHKEILHDNLNDNLRAFKSRLDRLCDKGELAYLGNYTYTISNHDKIDQNFLERITKWLNSRLLDVGELRPEVVYKKFEAEFIKAGIRNKYELYSELVFLLSNEFSFGYANTQSIRLSDTEKVTIEKRIISYVQNHGKTVPAEKISSDIGIPLTSVNHEASNSKILGIRNKNIYLIEINISKEARLFFDDEIKKQFKAHNGYIFPKEIKNNIENSTHFNDLLSIKGVAVYFTELDYFSDLLTYLWPSLKGFTQVKYVESRPTDEKIIDDWAGERTFTRIELTNFLTSIGYIASSIYSKINQLLRNNSMTEVDVDVFVLTKYIIDWQRSGQVKDAVNQYIKNIWSAKSVDNKFLSLATVMLNTNSLPSFPERSFKLSWTKKLLKDEIQYLYEYRLLEWNANGRNFDTPDNPLIIVPQESEVVDIIDLTRIMMKSYQGGGAVKEVISYLNEIGILLNAKATDIPHVLDSLFIVNEFGAVQMKENYND